MYTSKRYRSPYPCYGHRPPKPYQGGQNSTAAPATLAAGLSTLSDKALYLIGLMSLLRDLVGPQGIREALTIARI